MRYGPPPVLQTRMACVLVPSLTCHLVSSYASLASIWTALGTTSAMSLSRQLVLCAVNKLT